MERCKIETSTKIVKTLKRKTYRAGARSRCETVPAGIGIGSRYHGIPAGPDMILPGRAYGLIIVIIAVPPY